MTESHTRRSFADQLDEVRASVLQLGELVCEAVTEATRTLLESDLDGARRLIEGDDVLDALTIDIEERCFQLLVLQSPMAGDLRTVICALRCASEIERCGDLASNISKAARRLYSADLDPKLRGMIDGMSVLAVRQLRFSLGAFRDGDEGRAAALDDLDDELDNLHRMFIEAIFESQRFETLDLRVGVQLALVGRYYERLGDHAVNVGERVQYQVSGWMPEYDGATRAHLRAVPLAWSPLENAPPMVERGLVVPGGAERRRLEALRRDFVANIGHELRTPVGALAVLADTLYREVEAADDTAGSSTVLRLSKRITDEADRLGRTIDDLLELSRIESGDQSAAGSLRVSEVVNEALARTRGAAELAEISVEAAAVEPALMVYGDRRQLVTALANLIDNAVAYSEPRSKVEVWATGDPSGVRFGVRDHGVGIPAADQERIFERFYRVDRARRRDTGGTGLGLAIVRHVALNHNGTVQVHSTEGEGATFELVVPGPDASPTGGAAPDVPRGAAPPGPGGEGDG